MKRILAFITALLLFVQPVVASNDPPYLWEDLHYENGIDEANGRIYYEAGTNEISKKIKFSMDMGLIDAYIPASTITREELRAALEFVFGGDYVFESYFDIDTTDKILTVDEAIIVFMDSVGYNNFFEITGRSNKNVYITEAQRIGLMNGVSYQTAKEKLTAENFYKMFYNFLLLEQFEGVYSKESSDYVFKGRTLMETELQLHFVEGVVRANQYTSLNGGPATLEGQLRINSTTYNCAEFDDLNDYLGYNVDALVNKEGKIVSIAVDENENTMFLFEDETAIRMSNDRFVFEYYDENDREKKLIIDTRADVVYNHVAHPDFTAADLKIKNGYIRFIDNNSDKKFDAVFVYEYKSFIPKSKDIYADTLRDKTDKDYDFGEVEKGLFFGIKNQDGQRISLEDVILTDGISVLTKYGTNVVTEAMVLPYKTYEGFYMQNNKSKATPYKIGDRMFALSAVYSAEVSGSFPHSIGDKILVILDMEDKIIDSYNVKDDIKYAWVIAAKAEEELFSSGYKLQIFAEDRDVCVLPVADKVKFEGVTVPVENVFNGTAQGANSFFDSNINKVIPQLIRYKVNAKDAICEIDLADKTNMGNGVINETDEFQLNYEGTLVYNETGSIRAFGGKYRNDGAKSIFFMIPEDPTRLDRYGIRFSGELWNENSYNVKIYDVDETYTPGAFVMNVPVHSTWMGEIYSYFVNYSGSIIDPQTGLVENYIAFNQGAAEYIDYFSTVKYVQKTSPAENWHTNRVGGARFDTITDITQLRRGDQYESTKDYLGKVQVWRLNLALDYTMPMEDQYFEVMRTASLQNAGLSTELFYGKDIHGFGRVMKVHNDGVILNAHTKDENSKEWNRSIEVSKDTQIRLYNYTKDEASMITVADLQEGDSVFYEFQSGVLKAFVVYRP